MEVKCICCNKYLGESKCRIDYPICNDCANILKEINDKNISLADVMKIRKEKGLD